MIEPPIEDVLAKAGGRFNLVLLASRRARQINSYYTQLGGGIGRFAPPQVDSLSHKPLTIALEEIAADKVKVTTEAPAEPEGDTLDFLLSYQAEPLDEEEAADDGEGDEAQPVSPDEAEDTTAAEEVASDESSEDR